MVARILKLFQLSLELLKIRRVHLGLRDVCWEDNTEIQSGDGLCLSPQNRPFVLEFATSDPRESETADRFADYPESWEDYVNWEASSQLQSDSRMERDNW